QPCKAPLPMGQLFWKKAQMAEIGEPAKHRDTQDFEGPALGQGVVPQPAPTLPVWRTLAAAKNRVAARPTAGFKPGLPHRLRLGAVENKPAEALELAPLTAVDERVVGKARGGDHAQAALTPAVRLAHRAPGRHGLWSAHRGTFVPVSRQQPR